MSTDFTYGGKQILSGGPLKPNGKDMPNDARTRVDCYADIATIPNPYVGLKITVKVDETNNNKMTDYIVKSLKADSIGIANSLIDEVVKYVDYLEVSAGGGSGEGLTATQLSNIAKIPAIQSTVDALPNNYASKNHNHSEYASSSHRHDASEIDNLPSGGGGLTSEQARQLQTAYEHSQSTHVNNVDINKYGIISVNFNHHPPYSVEEYEIAYNNIEGFKKALEDMSNAGINHVTFPKGYYPMCYRCNSSGKPHFSHSMEWCIRIPSNMIVDLNGSTIKVIYDSENKNQYDKSDYEPSKLVGALFKFDKTYYSTIKNGNLLGDRYDRAYSDATKELDRRVEQTYGIFVTNGSRYCKVENMKISGFMGDAIQSNGNDNSDLGKINNKTTFFPGYIDSEGNYLTDKDDRYTTDFMECIDLKTNEVVLRTNIGYAYVPAFKDQKFEVTFYDDSKKLIGRKTSEHLYSIILTEGTKFIRLTLFNEDAGQISISKTFQITTTPSTNFEVINTEIYDCNRGGMSNLPLDTIVRNCNLYNNGVSNNPKWLDFPDTTRYAINCEDTVVRNFTLENSYIHNCFNTILLSAKKAIINNNTFENCSLQVVGLYNGKDCIISNNQLTNCGGIVSLTDKQNKTVIIKNNLCTKVGNIVGDIHHHSIIVDSNVFVDFLGLSLNSGNIRYSNNTFTSASQHNNTYYTYYLAGKILNCEIDILHEPYSTCVAILDMDKFSQNNIININGSNRCKLYNVYNSVINLNGVTDDVPNKCINVVNSSILNMPSFLIAFYGASQEELITYNFKDSNIYNCSTFIMSSNSSHNASKKVNTHLIFENCTVELSSITSNCVFDIGISLLNEQQNVKITLKNSKFINKSSINNINLFRKAYPERITTNIENCVFENIINNS